LPLTPFGDEVLVFLVVDEENNTSFNIDFVLSETDAVLEVSFGSGDKEVCFWKFLAKKPPKLVPLFVVVVDIVNFGCNLWCCLTLSSVSFCRSRSISHTLLSAITSSFTSCVDGSKEGRFSGLC
jgi:hypothetical protein